MDFSFGPGMVRFDQPCVVAPGAVECFRERTVVGAYLSA